MIFEEKFSVAPMMEWTDRHCRYFHRLLSGSAVLYTEMISADALIFGPRHKLLVFNNEELPCVLQLGGNDPKKLSLAAKFGQSYGYSKINLNIGWFGLGIMAIFYGTISGVILGPGSVLLTALAANGLVGGQIIGTDAFVTLINCTIRLISFWNLGLLNLDALYVGSLIGLVSIFGSYTAKKIADKLGVKMHTIIIEVCVVLGGAVMIYRAFTF